MGSWCIHKMFVTKKIILKGNLFLTATHLQSSEVGKYFFWRFSGAQQFDTQKCLRFSWSIQTIRLNSCPFILILVANSNQVPDSSIAKAPGSFTWFSTTGSSAVVAAAVFLFGVLVMLTIHWSIGFFWFARVVFFVFFDYIYLCLNPLNYTLNKGCESSASTETFWDLQCSEMIGNLMGWIPGAILQNFFNYILIFNHQLTILCNCEISQFL